MKTKISLLIGLTTGLLFAAALPLAALPGPDDYKKLQDEVNKAYLQDQADKAAAKSKASTSTSALAPGMRSWANGPQNSSAPNASPTRQPLPTSFSNRYAPASPQSPSASDKKGTLFDVNNPNGVDNAGSQQSTSDTEDWHKKNKKNKQKHHDASNTYDGSPITYHKPKPMSGTEDWHKMNKNSASHKMANTSYDGAPILYHKPKPMSDTGDWHKMNKNEHHHHHDSNWR
jgi:hypothetical protein